VSSSVRALLLLATVALLTTCSRPHRTRVELPTTAEPLAPQFTFEVNSQCAGWQPHVAHDLLVQRARDRALMWVVQSMGAEADAATPSSIVYGSVPRNWRVIHPAEPLQIGERYRVSPTSADTHFELRSSDGVAYVVSE
jgi:hypothetical protein